jgi:transposase
MAAVAITRDEHTAAALRQEAARCRDSDAARRMLALALVKEGQPRAEAARLCGMDRQTLRDWVHRYNEAGLAGLSDKQGRPGPKPRLSAEQEAEVAGLVRSGPDVAKDGIVRWRRADLARVIEDRFSVSLAERTVGSLLRRLGFAHVSVRPRHPRGDAAAQASFRPRSAPS